MSPAAANKQSPTGDGGDRSKIGQRVGLHNLSPAPGSRRPRKRVGRGEGSGTGKTSGRGQKGAGARSGSKRRARFEGGQMPIHMRMRKLRGPHMKKSMPFEPFRTHTQPVNIADLERRFDAGAEIINDISGLRFDERLAAIAGRTGAGLVLMHSRGTIETLHLQPPVDDILSEVASCFRRAIDIAHTHGAYDAQIALDVGLGFGKTFEQNLELLAKLDKIESEFKAYPVVVGASRKSFLGRILGDIPAGERLGGSLAAALTAIRKGAKIIRVHDVKETVAAIKVAAAIESF